MQEIVDPYLRVHRIRLVILSILSISFIFTMTNLIPLSLSFIVFAIFLPLLMVRQTSWHPVLFKTGILLLYFLLLTLIYDPFALFDYSFYRRDGNVFITLLPIVLFALMQFTFNVKKLVSYFVISVSLVNFAAAAAYQFWGIGESLAGTCYSFLFFTHNAAGGFLAMLSALSMALWVAYRKKKYLCLFLGNLVTLYMTDSRGSMLALILAFFMHFVLKEKHVKKIMVIVSITTLAILSITYPRWQEYGRDLSYLEADTASIEQDVKLEFSRSYTVLDRALFLWPRAFFLWISSPVFGTGFGSYNDLPYNLEGIPNFLMINMPEEYVYSDGHAHHTFFHVLAETGIVGLGLLILMLMSVRRFILGINSQLLYHGLLLMFWIAVWSSMTEHRLFTPSQMLPFTILLGVSLGIKKQLDS